MPYIFSASGALGRFNSYQSYKILNSNLLKAGLITAIVLSVMWIGSAWFNLFPLSGVMLGIGILLVSIAFGLLLALVFGITYYPYVVPTKTVAELASIGQKGDANIAQAASFDLIGLIDRQADNVSERGLLEVFGSLLKSTRVQTLLDRLELYTPDLVSAVEHQVISEINWQVFSEITLGLAYALESDEITVEHAMAGFLMHPGLKNYLRDNDLQEIDIQNAVWWMTTLQQRTREHKRWWDKSRMIDFTGIGLAWTSGYTPLVDQFSRIPRGNLWDQITLGREQYVDQLISTLARQRQSNVLLVGQPGVGRLGVIQDLARRVQSGQAHVEINGLRVVYIHIGELLGRAESQASQLSLVSQVLGEMEAAGNIITVLDGISSILGKEGEQRVNLTEVLLPFFSSMTVRVVVIISSDEYHLRLRANEELIHYFEVVKIPSVSAEVALKVLSLAVPYLEQQTGVLLPYKSLRAISTGTSDILPQIPLPERAFDVLEEVLVVAQARGEANLTVDLVNEMISKKVGVPIGRPDDEERDYLLNLEEIMHRRLVNQDKAVAAVARAMIRARAGVRNVKRPIGTFLFLGPTGVGKTETAKTLAQAYFGSEDYMTRLDMSEFQGSDGVAALIGNQQQPVGRLTSLIADHPFTVLLLDEFEKANKNVHQLFLQVFDEGHLSDARGQEVSFKHAILIATSNAGAEFIRENVARGPLPDNFDEQLRDIILSKQLLSPELLNRFDGVITFTPLSQDHLKQIARLMLEKLNRRLDAQHGVTVAITDKMISYLLEIGYNPEFGARPMSRAIQNSVEYEVAQRVLKGELRPGQEIDITPEQLRASSVN